MDLKAFTLVYLLLSHSIDGKLRSRTGKGLAPYYTAFWVANLDRLYLNVHM